MDLHATTAQLGVSGRHLRRVFTEHVGVAPKEYARSARLQRAVRLAASPLDWSSVAQGAGYYDQAHLISDFRRLVGVTPGSFRAALGELTSNVANAAEPEMP